MGKGCAHLPITKVGWERESRETCGINKSLRLIFCLAMLVERGCSMEKEAARGEK